MDDKFVIIDQCFMWCMAKGIKPLSAGSDIDEVLRLSAIIDNRTPFAELNDMQRQYIAGAQRP